MKSFKLLKLKPGICEFLSCLFHLGFVLGLEFVRVQLSNFVVSLAQDNGVRHGHGGRAQIIVGGISVVCW